MARLASSVVVFALSILSVIVGPAAALGFLPVQAAMMLGGSTASNTALAGVEGVGYNHVMGTFTSSNYMCRAPTSKRAGLLLGTATSENPTTCQAVDGTGAATNLTSSVELLTGPSCWQPALAGTVAMAGYPTFPVTPGYYLDIGLDVVTKYLLSACRAIVSSNTTSTLAVAVGRVAWQNPKGEGVCNFPVCIINYNGVVYKPLQFDMLVAC